MVSLHLPQYWTRAHETEEKLNQNETNLLCVISPVCRAFIFLGQALKATDRPTRMTFQM